METTLTENSVEPKSGKYFDNTTPITNEVICKVPRSKSEKDVDFALVTQPTQHFLLGEKHQSLRDQIYS